jgi:hypothetical protein
MITEQLIQAIPDRKQQISAAAQTIADRIDSGELNAMLALANFKTFEKVFEKAKESVIQGALKEANKYPEKTIEQFGVKFEKAEAGVSYDYSACGHEDYDLICAEIVKLTDKKKEFEKLLQSIKEPTGLTNTSTGETFVVNPPLKKSTTTLKVTI